MENAGAVTFTEQYLFRDTVVDAMRAYAYIMLC